MGKMKKVKSFVAAVMAVFLIIGSVGSSAVIQAEIAPVVLSARENVVVDTGQNTCYDNTIEITCPNPYPLGTSTWCSSNPEIR